MIPSRLMPAHHRVAFDCSALFNTPEDLALVFFQSIASDLGLKPRLAVIYTKFEGEIGATWTDGSLADFIEFLNLMDEGGLLESVQFFRS